MSEAVSESLLDPFENSFSLTVEEPENKQAITLTLAFEEIARVYLDQ